jgi:glycosyltransferase involved in cell wall biosynthesis
MKILEVIPSLQSAGAERLVVELSNELSRREGIEVTILQLYPFNEKDLLKPLVDKTVIVKSLNKPKGFNLFCYFKLAKFIKNGKYDVVHTHTNATLYLLWTTLINRGPIYCSTIHSDAKREAGGLLTSCLKKILYKFRLCVPITISERSNQSFVDYYHLQAPIIYNGIKPFNGSLPKDNKNKGLFVFVHIARTHPIKNQVMLYRCINRLALEGYKVLLYHYGRFYDEEVSKQLESLKTDNIIFAGETEMPQIILQQADALCMSSLMEGMPMTIIEAFSVACPVITTPVGGCVNMVKEGYNGLLSKSTDEVDYYEALKKFVNLTYEEREEMKKNAYKSFKKYDIRETAENYLKVFKKQL